MWPSALRSDGLPGTTTEISLAVGTKPIVRGRGQMEDRGQSLFASRHSNGYREAGSAFIREGPTGTNTVR